jgi:trigger factor
MATATDTQVVVEDVGPAKKRLKITIPPSVVDAKIDQAYATIRQDAVLPGFRRGAAPMALIEKRFGEAVINDARSQLLSEAYSKALTDHKLQPVGEPELDEKTNDLEVKRGKALNLTMDVEIVPDIAMPALDSIEVRKPVADISAKHIDEEIRRLSYRLGTPGQIEGPFEKLDRMVGKAVVHVKGHEKDPYFETDRCLVVVPDAEDEGRGQVLGLLVEDLGKHLEGSKVGTALKFTTSGPEGHEREDLRGKEITIDFTPSQAERIAPATPEEIAEKLGLGTVDNVKEQTKLSLEARRDQEQRAAMREQAAEWLVSAVDFPLPEKMSGAQVHRNLEMARLQFLSQGMTDDDVERRLAEMRSASEMDTQRRLKLFFVLAKLAQDFGIGVSEAEVNGAIVQMARTRGLRPDQVRQDLQKDGRLNEMALAIREAKTLDRVLDSAKVSDIPAEEWNKQVEERQKKSAKGSKEAGDKAPSKKPAAKKA